MERLSKLAFITCFPDTISIEIQQAPLYQTSDHGGRVLTMNGDQSQDVVAAVHSPHSGATPPAKSDPITSITLQVQWQRISESIKYAATNVGRLDPGLETFEKQDRGQGINANLLPNQDVKTALPVPNMSMGRSVCCLIPVVHEQLGIS